MSGGRATIGAATGNLRTAQAGDIGAIDPMGAPLTNRFFVECKHYACLDLSSMVCSHSGKFVRFWKKLCVDSAVVSKMPMLIAKENNRPTLFCLDDYGVQVLTYPSPDHLATLVTVEKLNMWIYEFDSFFSLVKPDVLL
jgi:hypothetical protein